MPTPDPLECHVSEGRVALLTLGKAFHPVHTGGTSRPTRDRWSQSLPPWHPDVTLTSSRIFFTVSPFWNGDSDNKERCHQQLWVGHMAPCVLVLAAASAVCCVQHGRASGVLPASSLPCPGPALP